MSWLPDAAVAVGVVGSVAALLWNLRKSKSDINDTVVDGYEELRKALCAEIERLNGVVLGLRSEVVALRQEIVILRGELSNERLKGENERLVRDARDSSVQAGGTVPAPPDA